MTLVKRLRAFGGFRNEMEICDEAADEIERLTAENVKLKAFACAILKDHPDIDLEGGVVQDLAIKHGLIVAVQVTEPCGEGCNCAEYFISGPEGKFCETENCYRVADFVKENDETKSGFSAVPLDIPVMQVLHLTLKKQWFDMIASGQKREEYREMKPYWHNRLMCAKGKFDVIHFRNGYSRDARAMTVEFCELSSGLGIVEWGAPERQEVYILRLGKILKPHNAI